MLEGHFERLSRYDLGFDFYGSDCVSESVLFSIIFGHHFLFSLFVLGVDIIISLGFGSLLLFFLTFTAYTSQNSLRVAGERQSIEIVCVGLIKLVKFGKSFEVKLISRVIKSFVGERIVSFEIYPDCDIVRGGCCEYLAPEQELVCIRKLD